VCLGVDDERQLFFGATPLFCESLGLGSDFADDGDIVVAR
jgi:hypothetical protein